MIEAGSTRKSQIVKAAVLPGMHGEENPHGQDGDGREELQVTTICLPVMKGEHGVIGQDGDHKVRLKEKRQVVSVVLLGIKGGALEKMLEALMATVD